MDSDQKTDFPGLHLRREISGPSSLAISIAGLAILLITLFLFFSALAKLVPFHSDSCYLILYADAMLAGNWTLDGWNLTTVGYYSEIPFYLAGAALVDVESELARLVPAFIYSLNVVLTGTLIWKNRITNRLWVLLPVLPFLVLPTNGIWPFALNGAIHMVTLTVSLLILLLLTDDLLLTTRIGGWLIAILSFVGMISDLAFLFILIVPLACAGLIRHVGNRETARAFAGTTLRNILLGGILGHIMLLVFRNVGVGAPVGNGVQRFANSSEFVPKVQILIDSWVSFFGVDHWGMRLTLVSASLIVLGVGVIWWWLAARRSILDRSSGLEVFCVCSLGSIVIATTLSEHGGGGNETRFIVPAFFLAVFLMSRYVQRQKPIVVATLIAATTGSSLIASNAFMTQNRMLLMGDGNASDLRRATAYLLNSGMAQGFGDYWSCHTVRVLSAGKVSIVPIQPLQGGAVNVDMWAADRRWFDQLEGQFYVFYRRLPKTWQQMALGDLMGKRIPHTRPVYEGTASPNLAAAIEYWGQPTKTTEFGDLVILEWAGGIHIRRDVLPSRLQ